MISSTIDSEPRRSSRRTFVRTAAALAAATAAGVTTPHAVAAEAAADKSTPGAPISSDVTAFAYGYDKEPYPLDPGPHLMIDWRYVLPGRTRYSTPTGESTNSSAEGLHGKLSTDEIVVKGDQSPMGIRLEAQPPTRLGPVIANDKPWEYSLCYPTLGQLDGKYRMWYEVIAPREQGGADMLCYAESTDGVKWEKPELGLVEFAGNKRNNIVFAESVAGHGFHGIGVFYDPSAASEQRYKLVYNSRGTPEQIAQLKAKRPGSVTSLGESKNLLICCAASPDGIRWKPLPQPLMSHMSDTGTTMYYDQVLRRYVGYFRTSFMNRRVVGRSECATLDEPWPAPETACWTDASESPSEDYYTNGKSLYPGTKTFHLLFPTIYERFSDSAIIRMLCSIDGKTWMFPAGRGNLLEQGPEGSWDGGCVFAGNGMAEIAGNRVALPYIGYGLPHKFPRLVRCGEVGFVVWQKQRLSAIVADEEGEFFTTPLSTPANTLRLNFHARRNGFVKVEIVGRNGRTIDDCDPLFGDSYDKTVTWKGQSALNALGGVTLRFRLRSAKLFSFETV
jgi:hypothetical protein